MLRNFPSILETLGYKLARMPASVMKQRAELVPTLSILAGYLNSLKKDIRFLQIGAYDGLSNDPLLAAAERYGWSGICVEPQPRAFVQLQKVYKDRPKVQLVQAAIGPSNEKKVFYSLKEDVRLPMWAYQLASFDRSHILKHQPMFCDVQLDGLILEEKVDCITFDYLLETTSIDYVDVLQIDVEGYDYELLKMFNLPSRLPSVVNFEHVHLSKSDWNSAAEMLINLGYRLAVAGWDTLAFRE